MLLLYHKHGVTFRLRNDSHTTSRKTEAFRELISILEDSLSLTSASPASCLNSQPSLSLPLQLSLPLSPSLSQLVAETSLHRAARGTQGALTKPQRPARSQSSLWSLIKAQRNASPTNERREKKKEIALKQRNLKASVARARGLNQQLTK